MSHPDYRRVETAIRYLDRHYDRQPSLDQVARAAGTSPFHFQRLFKRWAGVSPKRFLQYLTIARARSALDGGASVLAASYDAGLSGPGRLHDLFVAVDAVTPGEFKAAGRGLAIRWGIHPSPVGPALIARTDRGICALEFVADPRRALARLARRWPGAILRLAPDETAPFAARCFDRAASGDGPITLHVQGTNFQLKVWEALLALSPGELVTYGELARRMGRPGAARAVGSAVARNPVGYLIPCHRVILSSGAFGNYQWGAARKRALIGWEAVG